MNLSEIVADESLRNHEFPVTKSKTFFAHAAVTSLPRRAVEAIQACADEGSLDLQELATTLAFFDHAREVAASLIGAKSSEIALLGPTGLGISLIAGGIDWQNGDEILCYRHDYPSNVYPWMEAERKGAKVRFLLPDQLGEITPDLVEANLTQNTRLVALASCHFQTGYAIDVEAIGRILQDRGVLFSLDAIQTLGARPVSVENVDFLCADSHKWLLGPCAAGIVFVKESRFGDLHPILTGAWNVNSPDFLTQDEVAFLPGARRYEPGVLNTLGIRGMIASMELLLEVGIENVHQRLLALKEQLVAEIDSKGYEIVGPRSGFHASGITTFFRPGSDMKAEFDRLSQNNVVASLRKLATGQPALRLSPHFYNTESEVERALSFL